MNEDEIRRILAELPVSRRIHARAALAGSASDLSNRVRHDEGALTAGWESGLSALYMTALAARYRPPVEVAQMADALDGDVCGGVLLDVASERPPDDLAAIALELARAPGESSADPERHLAWPFLRRVVARRLPADLARLLANPRLRDQDELRRHLTVLITAGDPAKIAQTVVHLRGAGVAGGWGEIVSEVTETASSERLADFIVSLSHYGDQQSVQQVIAGTTAWKAPSPAGPDSPATPQVDELVNRILGLVAELQRNKQPDLAEQVITSAVKDFAVSDQQYRLYGLVYVFKQRGLDDEAERFRAMISASATSKDEVAMITEFCRGQQDAGITAGLVRSILKVPTPGVTENAAVRLVAELPDALPDIFLTVAEWQHENLAAFEGQLRRHSLQWAEQFRDTVADTAGSRNDGDGIAALVIWLLTDPDLGRGKERASKVIEKLIRRRAPGLMIETICQLHDYPLPPECRHEGWWTLRQQAAQQIAARYSITDLISLVDKGRNRCLATLLRLAPDWLIYGQRSDEEILTLVRTLEAARPNLSELHDMVEFSASKFTRLPDLSTGALFQRSPAALLRKEGLTREATAWRKGDSVMRFRHRRPDPDPPPR